MSQIRYFAEKLYHLNVFLRLSQRKDIDINSQILEEIKGYLTRYITKSYIGDETERHTQIDRLLNEIENDDDLKKVIDSNKLDKLVQEWRKVNI